jgi:large conductance mechanosensitive channel
MLKEFKEFAFRGNMLDLAVGIIIGAAFGTVVGSFAKDLLTPLVAPLFGVDRVENMKLGPMLVGNFIAALVGFLLTAFALFFVVRAINRVMGPKDAPPEPPTRRECPYCTTSIPIVATRCPACTSTVEPVPAAGPAAGPAAEPAAGPAAE